MSLPNFEEEKSLSSDRALILRFADTVYYPLLSFVPKDWLQDFTDISLTFGERANLIQARYSKRTFAINVDLRKLEGLTRRQLKANKHDNPPLVILVYQFFGNLAYAIIRAFHGYTEKNHPEAVKGKDPRKMSFELLKQLEARGAEWERRNLKKVDRYIA